MVSIESDNADIERCLERILAETRRGGAAFADDLVLRCADRGLSIELPPGSPAHMLIKLPQQMLVPTRSFGLALQGDDIVITAIDPDVTPARRALMESIVALYNLTGKIAWYRQSSAVLFLRARPELARLVARGSDAGMQSVLLDPAAAGGLDGFVLRRFLGTRWLNLGAEPATGARAMLAPVIDLMNHNARGAPFLNREDAGGRYVLIERAMHASADERECFVCYGFYDPLETLLGYNFVDESSMFARSVPVEIALPAVGRIRVGDGHGHRELRGLPDALRDIQIYLPRIVVKRPRELEVGFLVIPPPTAPQVLRRVLNVMIASLDRDCVDRLDLILEAERQVIAANKAHYADLWPALTAAAAQTPDSPILRDLRRASELRMSYLQRYEDMVRAHAA
jgi:hypothetical protein